MADTVYNTTAVDDGVQHGIDDNPNNDAKKGAELGGVGGAVTGAIAGAAAGPGGMILGAIIGGVAGAVASGAAVAAVDQVDNDNTVSVIGDGATTDVNDTAYTTTSGAYVPTGTVGNAVPGVQTGGYANDGTPDTRGVLEKTADAVTGDPVDDKTGRVVHHDTLSGAANSGIGTGVSTATGLGETTPSIKTGGYANDGTPDTRGLGEKTVDAITGDTVDDKTGKVVNHP